MAVSGAGGRIVKMSAQGDSLPGPLKVQGLRWIGQTSHVIAAGDRLVLNNGFEHFAEAGRLGCDAHFSPPLFIPSGSALTASTMANGALIVILE